MEPISHSEFKQQIQEMDPTRFEHFVADLWSAQGWNTRVTQEQGDRGIDIVATKDSPVSEKHLIQAKRYGPDNPVGSPDVQQYASLRQQEQAVDAVVIVTSGQFSEQAERIARDLNVKLIDGDELYEIVRSHNLSSVVTDYLKPSGESSERPNQVQSSSENTTDTTHEGLEFPKWSLGVTASVLLIILVILGGVIAFGTFGGDRLGDSTNPAAASPDTTTPDLTPTSKQNGATTGTVRTSSALAVGESTTHAGLRFSVLEYRTANRLGDATPNEYAQDVLPVTAPSGAQFLLVKVRVTNVGEQEYTPPDSWMLSYYGDGVIPQSLGNFTVNGTRYVVYSEVRNQQPTEDPGIYPGDSLTGWIVFEVPDRFNSSAAVVTVDYETKSGDTWTARWELDETHSNITHTYSCVTSVPSILSVAALSVDYRSHYADYTLSIMQSVSGNFSIGRIGV